MKNKTNGADEAQIDEQPCATRQAMLQFHLALGSLTGKWKGEILWQLVQSKRRFGELRRLIPGVTQHMLTTQLRDLEADGLVKRTSYPEIPPRVEYETTPAAEALKPVFDALLNWSEDHGLHRGGKAKAASPDARTASLPAGHDTA